MTTMEERKSLVFGCTEGGRRSPLKEKAGAWHRPERASIGKVLEVELDSELKLSWIKRCCRTAVVTTIGGALVERVDVVDEG